MQIIEENSKYHQTGGYLSVERFPYTSPDAKILLQGLEEFGLKQIDINGESQLGSTNAQTTSKNGSRQSTNVAFIRPIREKRSNLFIRTKAFVTKILIDPNTKKALGVEYTSTLTGESRKVVAKKEVIISAGAVNSPQLLMVSGIGPIEELQKYGISVIKNLSVGYNLHDHVTFTGLPVQIGDKQYNFSNFPQRLEDLYYYLSTHRGPFSSEGVSSISAFFRTEYEKSQSAPDIQLFFLGYESVYFNQFLVLPTLITPKSKGFIKLNVTDPVWGAPIIDVRYFRDDSDLKRLLQSVRISLGLFNTSAFKENNFKLIDTSLPFCNAFEYNTDDYWICVIKQYSHTLYHPVGTCKMGPEEDTEAVVDPSLRVYGINNLRVVDASVMPVIPRANTNAPTIMVAEKASDMIKHKWKGSHADASLL